MGSETKSVAPGLELFFFFFLIYLFMAVLGLRFCARAFSSCGKLGPLFIAVRGPLTIAASVVAEHRLQTRRLSNCGSRPQLPQLPQLLQLLHSMWDLPGPGLKPVSPALAGTFSTTAPPGKPWSGTFLHLLARCFLTHRCPIPGPAWFYASHLPISYIWAW